VNGSHISRKGTDRKWCFGLVIYISLMVVAVAFSIWKGQPKRLTHSYNFKGQLCGVDDGVEGLDFLYFCGGKDWQAGYPTHLDYNSKTCVKECPSAANPVDVACLLPETHQFSVEGPMTDNNIEFLSTYKTEVVQSVAWQSSYPSEVYKGRVCVPVAASNGTGSEIRQQLIDGPLSNMDTLQNFVGSFGTLVHPRAWPVLVGAAVLAVILGVLYLLLMARIAGPLMFLSLVTTIIVVFGLGFYFFIGLFFDSTDEKGGYQSHNPLFRSVPGLHGKMNSVFFGLLLFFLGTCLVFTTMNLLSKIDESVGMISASLDCIFSSCCGLMMQPIIAAAIIIALVCVLIAGLALIHSVGYMDDTNITINGVGIRGLQRTFKWYWGWNLVNVFYLLGCWWLFEICISYYQYVITFAVCKWYFSKGHSEKKKSSSPGTPIQNSTKSTQVWVSGQGRQGFQTKLQNGQQVVVVPVGKKGPGGSAAPGLPTAVNFGAEEHEVKTMPASAVIAGSASAFTYHLGSLAKGAIYVSLTRIFRLLSMGIRGVVGKSDKRGSFDQEDSTIKGMAIQVTGLLAGLLDAIFAGYSKNAYCDIVLTSKDFAAASRDAVEFIVGVGGVVAFLHGTCTMYELVGLIGITGICSMVTFILLTSIDAFSNPLNENTFVADPWLMTLLSALICGIISYAFMSLINITTDGLLYTFAWARHEGIKNDKYVPASMKGLVAAEMDAEPEKQLHAHGDKLNPFHGQYTTAFTTAAGNMGTKAMGTMRGTMGTMKEHMPLLTTTNPDGMQGH